MISENIKKEIELWIAAAIIGVGGFKLCEWFLSTELGDLELTMLRYPIFKLFA